ncbi:hypothetical protein D3C80_2065990 [compost metagenome]
MRRAETSTATPPVLVGWALGNGSSSIRIRMEFCQSFACQRNAIAVIALARAMRKRMLRRLWREGWGNSR